MILGFSLKFLVILLLASFCWFISVLAAGGGAILFIPLAQFLFPLKVIIPALAIGSFVGCLHRVFLFWRFIRWDVLVFLLPGVLLGSLLGTFLFSRMEMEWLSLILAFFLLFHVYRDSVKALKASFPMRKVYFFYAAFFTAIFSSLVGAAGPVMNPFYLNSDVEKEQIIATKAFATLVMQLAKIGGYLSFISLDPQIGKLGVFIGVGTLFGNVIGKRVLARLSVGGFKKWANGFLFISALLMMGKFLQTFFPGA